MGTPAIPPNNEHLRAMIAQRECEEERIRRRQVERALGVPEPLSPSRRISTAEEKYAERRDFWARNFNQAHKQ